MCVCVCVWSGGGWVHCSCGEVGNMFFPVLHTFEPQYGLCCFFLSPIVNRQFTGLNLNSLCVCLPGLRLISGDKSAVDP